LRLICFEKGKSSGDESTKSPAAEMVEVPWVDLEVNGVGVGVCKIPLLRGGNVIGRKETSLR